MTDTSKALSEVGALAERLGRGKPRPDLTGMELAQYRDALKKLAEEMVWKRVRGRGEK